MLQASEIAAVLCGAVAFRDHASRLASASNCTSLILCSGRSVTNRRTFPARADRLPDQWRAVLPVDEPLGLPTFHWVAPARAAMRALAKIRQTAEIEPGRFVVVLCGVLPCRHPQCCRDTSSKQGTCAVT